MSIQTPMTNATSTAASLFAKLLLAAAVVFVLLLLSIHFGWSMLAGFIFMIAGLATSAFCLVADTVKGWFGKGRAVGLGIVSLYLSLMATLAYATPDFFSGLGINGWMGLTTIFFAATTGGSVALISFEKASKVVAVLVISLTGFGLISGHVFARGVQYLASNAASALGRRAYSMGAEFEDSEGDIKVKYRAEYQVKKDALEKEWESGKITAKVYEEKRKALDKEYERVLKPEPTVVQAAPQATSNAVTPNNSPTNPTAASTLVVQPKATAAGLAKAIAALANLPACESQSGPKIHFVPNCPGGMLIGQTDQTRTLILLRSNIQPNPFGAEPGFPARVDDAGLNGIDYQDGEDPKVWEPLIVIPGKPRFGTFVIVGTKLREFAPRAKLMTIQKTDPPVPVRLVYNGVIECFKKRHTGDADYTFQ